MFRTKYHDGVRAARAAQRPVSEMPPFDPERLRSSGLIARAVSAFLENPRPATRFFRRYWPILSLGKTVIVFKNADVREVLERQEDFETPFGPEMEEMAGGANFVLGMQDGGEYRRIKSALLSAFPPSEIETVVRPIAARHSAGIMRGAVPGFDAVDRMLKTVPVRICRDYFGMVIEDELAFADWAIALSSLFFADPTGNAKTRELAVVASERMLATIDRSLARVRAGFGKSDTPLARLVAIRAADPAALGEDEIRSVMMGMIAGFTPTNLLAAGNALDVVLTMPEARAAVEAALAAGDDAALTRAIDEAMRFKPINPGPFRYVPRDTVLAKGTGRQKTLKAGTTVWPWTLSAMFDADDVKQPERFDPDRPQRNSLVFGHGIHWCVGAALARVQIGEAFRALFSKPGLRRAAGAPGRLARRGAFPESLCVDFDVSAEVRAVGHSFVTIAVPVAGTVAPARLRAMVEALGNPADSAIRAAFDATGLVHFASLSVIGKADQATERPDDPKHLVFEFSADGDQKTAIAAVADGAGPWLRPVFEAAGALDKEGDFAALLHRHALAVSPAPGDVAGLCFTGTPGHSVRRILAEEELCAEANEIVCAQPADAGDSALDRLDTVRRALADKGGYDWAFQAAPSGLDAPAGDVWDMVRKTVSAPRLLAGIAAVFGILSACILFFAFEAPFDGVLRGFFSVLAALLLGLLALCALVGLPAAIVYWRFRRLEREPQIEAGPLPPDRFEAITAREDHGVQNHLAAISVMKPGRLRRLALRLAFFTILQFVRHVFAPGRLADIGSIHYARWVLLPGTDKLLFFSNYGGSWGSYLEDFITKAAKGLTGVWSNTAGFPKARNLFFDGATDGDRFKLWARAQQIPTLFWYSAYPALNTGAIRRNAAIRRGLATARTDSEAAAWLALFGSKPRTAGGLETEDIQSILFGGMGRLAEARMVALRMPEHMPRAARRDWLDHLVHSTAFGGIEPTEAAMVSAFAPGGLVKLGLSGLDGGLPGSFPTTFRHGMADPHQNRVLGDVGDNAPEHWEWGNADEPVDAVLVLYADTRQRLEKNVDALANLSAAAGMETVASLPLTIERDVRGKPIEHFGFRDGISQPVIAGTPRALRAAAAQHRIAAGEFVLGYPDELGRLPPSPMLGAGLDARGRLSGRDRAASAGEDPQWRDFGRNGSFLVIRQLAQNVGAFEKFCRDTARALGRTEIAGRPAPEWVGAKMLGRWKDGTSLIGHPEWRAGQEPDNDFLFASDDAQGRQCPFGAHIRRSNPRDSLGAKPETQIQISKRHRILRIGRTYARQAKGGKKAEKGMVFMCLNADIERQFAFVQQTWVNNRGFESLRGEADPLVGNVAGEGCFTVAGPEGPLRLKGLSAFVTLRGGGYFFVPSRRALRYLRSQS
ncbi:cytochrome P450 [Nitratireductor sp. CAU 1489]|uniref:Cytochrome P450 n=1 Tax=Nitratireductor arenosus TaxID=2682096 RepID=A0A844QGM5_9HYPH|nr:cytochrome P450 [Nitratireductor arenosus]MVA98435.1 cytochrome P450 [Nitratireductor arenosus]